MTRGTNRRHLARAVVECMAYQTADVVGLMQEESGVKLAELRVDGGASVMPFLLQFQADLLGVTVRRPVIPETTALGAALLAGLATGYGRVLQRSRSAGCWTARRFPLLMRKRWRAFIMDGRRRWSGAWDGPRK